MRKHTSAVELSSASNRSSPPGSKVEFDRVTLNGELPPLSANPSIASSPPKSPHTSRRRAHDPRVPTVSLAALLNDPAGRPLNIFSKAWGEGFEHAKIVPNPLLKKPSKSVTENCFKNYKKLVHKRMRPAHTRTHVHGGTAAESSLSEGLALVPDVFLAPDMCIEDPEVFRTVFHDTLKYCKEPADPNSQDRRTPFEISTEDTTRMYKYCESVIEGHLANQVSAKGNAVFKVLSSQQEIQESNLHVATQVTSLRRTLASVRDGPIKKTFTLTKLALQIANREKLLKLLKTIVDLKSVKERIHLFLLNNQYMESLALIDQTVDNLTTHYSDLSCVGHLATELQWQKTENIPNCLRSNFEAALVDSIGRNIEDAYATPDEFALQLQCHGIIYMKEHAAIIPALYTKSEDLIKTVISNDLKNPKFNVSVTISHLTAPELNSLLTTVTRHLQTALGRVSELTQIFADCAKKQSLLEEDEESGQLSPTAAIFEPNLSTKITSNGSSSAFHLLTVNEASVFLKNLLANFHKIVLLAFKEVSDIIKAHHASAPKSDSASVAHQIKTSTQSEINDFIKLQTIARQFKMFGDTIFSEVEVKLRPNRSPSAINGSKTSSMATASFSLLDSVMRENRIKFVRDRSTVWNKRLMEACERETWQATSQIAAVQTLLGALESTGKFWVTKNGMTRQTSVNGAGPPFNGRATFENKAYLLFSSTAVLIEIIFQICEMSNCLPESWDELTQALIDAVKRYNCMLSTRLIMCEAVQKDQIKAIGPLQLAISMQCLSLLRDLLPHLESFMKSLSSKKQSDTSKSSLNPPRIFGNFDKISSDLTSHVNALNKKLSDVLERELCNDLNTWECKPPSRGPAIQAVIDHINTTHRAIGDILPQATVHDLFGNSLMKLCAKFSERMVAKDIRQMKHAISFLLFQEIAAINECLEKLGLPKSVCTILTSESILPPHLKTDKR